MTRKLLLGTLILLLSACAPREWLLPRVGITPPALRDFPADYTPPLANETEQPMVGFGAAGEVNHTPVIFIHGNTVSARFWLPARSYFEKSGYNASELWALGYGWDNVRYFDSDDLSVESVQRMVDSVTEYLSKKTGRPIQQVDIVAHSLGVTLVRQWMKQNNQFHRVRNFVAACGANQGVWTAWPDTRGQNRVVSFELAPNSPWLTQLNRGGDTPGPTRYMTLYDGTGWGDVLFPPAHKNDSALKGAYNLPYNVVHGTHYGHLELPREPGPMQAMIEFFQQAHEPLPNEAAPRLVLADGKLKANQPDAMVRCAGQGIYPTSTTQPLAEVDVRSGELLTCYAHSERTQLSSPMARYKFSAQPVKTETLTLTAAQPAGVYENPITVTLSASEPDAFVVYTTSGQAPDSGSPLYEAPVVVPGPLTLTAVAIAPDGRRSAPLTLAYDISLEKIDAAHTLQRQFDTAAPEKFKNRRRVGR